MLEQGRAEVEGGQVRHSRRLVAQVPSRAHPP
jgi:hypothetical protein